MTRYFASAALHVLFFTVSIVNVLCDPEKSTVSLRSVQKKDSNEFESETQDEIVQDTSYPTDARIQPIANPPPTTPWNNNNRKAGDRRKEKEEKKKKMKELKREAMDNAKWVIPILVLTLLVFVFGKEAVRRYRRRRDR